VNEQEPFNLDRFVTAQAPLFDTVMAELTSGRKRSHWMWFIFPQLRGLGRSPLAIHYGIASLEEARAYLGHALLGPRLLQATEMVLESPAPSLNAMLGSPDDIKFRSSMTLFAMASGEAQTPFATALDHWCDGQKDEATLALLDGQ